MSDGKIHLSVVVCGHVDAGKSTTCGHLIFKQGGISQREMDKLQAMAEEKGKSSFGFAYYLDTCKEERERGVTIQCNTKEFFTEKVSSAVYYNISPPTQLFIIGYPRLLHIPHPPPLSPNLSSLHSTTTPSSMLPVTRITSRT